MATVTEKKKEEIERKVLKDLREISERNKTPYLWDMMLLQYLNKKLEKISKKYR